MRCLVIGLFLRLDWIGLDRKFWINVGFEIACEFNVGFGLIRINVDVIVID